ncbi:peptidoglycan-binding domain-containing protein [Sphingomonas hengshuiensis]|uniref:peptidoglycan-binding domain-containing protein n=1 Tax=Sphingomonas hengshuiensis TaxID=1609977 RepID=UPI000696DBB9|nr:peptidoglycan-binding domain-containing protein [Sphingomonas hengshuiensis]
MAIAASVGTGGANDLADVIVVQHLLNAWLTATGQEALPTAGTCGPRTIAAIKGFQSRVMGRTAPDGRIDPGGQTWAALTAAANPPAPLSGAAWWHANQARFPNSAALADLAPPFRDKAKAFVQAMRDAGASVTLSATLRNRTRAHLMHYCWRIAKGDVAPGAVPALPGCAIRWDHGDTARSKRGAQEMVDLFAIAYQPSLTSRHIEGRAVDMTIGWTGTITVRDATGAPRPLAAPRSGESNADLHRIGKSYGVFKLLSDPPHWSDDGH